MGYALKQSQTAQPLLFLLVDSGDHITGKTGLSPTVTLSKNGGAFAGPSGAVSELGNGWYRVAGNATDTGTLGPLLLHATAAGADPCDDRYDVVAFDPQSETNLGLSNLDAAVSSRSTYAGGDTAGTTTLLSRIPGVVAAQTGDAYARIGAGGAGLTALGDTRLANLDAAVSSRLAAAAYTSPDNTGIGVAAAAAAAAATNIGTAGAGLTALGDARLANLDAAVSTRSTYAGADTSGTTTLLARIPGTVAAQSGDAYARLGSPAGASVSADLATITAAVDTVEGRLPAALVSGRMDCSVGAVAAAAAKIKKNAPLAGFTFVMTDSGSHVPTAGLAVTATRSLDGAAFAACTNPASAVANGAYKIDLAAADLNANTVLLRFAATGADDTLVTLITQP